MKAHVIQRGFVSRAFAYNIHGTYTVSRHAISKQSVLTYKKSIRPQILAACKCTHRTGAGHVRHLLINSVFAHIEFNYIYAMKSTLL